ncbi:MAG: succinate dehydrogenase assembly factor 2 [Gammaproteobacteria bacterium]
MNDVSFAKLQWQCRRGMLELDVILNRFLTESYPHITPQQQAAFAQLLTCTDAELWGWLMEDQPAPQGFMEIVALIKQ